MKKFINKKLYAAMFYVVLLAACTKEPGIVQTKQSIDEVINTDPELSMFAYMVKKSNLDIFTKGGGPFTFFIPTNAALTAVGITSTTHIDQMEPLYLTILASYHFQGNLRSFYEIPEGPNATMNTQTNIVQYASRRGDKAYINGVELLDKGTEASNGIYYKVGELILPPVNTNAITTMQAMGDKYTLMLQAIAKTGTTTSFTTSPATVFALPNSVMLANGYDSVTIANIKGNEATILTNKLRYHVIPQRIFKSDFKPANLLTRYTSNSVIIEGSVGNFTIKGKNNTTSTPVGNGTANGAGVFYSIEQMLKP